MLLRGSARVYFALKIKMSGSYLVLYCIIIIVIVGDDVLQFLFFVFSNILFVKTLFSYLLRALVFFLLFYLQICLALKINDNFCIT